MQTLLENPQKKIQVATLSKTNVSYSPTSKATEPDLTYLNYFIISSKLY